MILHLHAKNPDGKPDQKPIELQEIVHFPATEQGKEFWTRDIIVREDEHSEHVSTIIIFSHTREDLEFEKPKTV